MCVALRSPAGEPVKTEETLHFIGSNMLEKCLNMLVMLCPTPLGKASLLSENGQDDFTTAPHGIKSLSYKKHPLAPSLSTGWIHIPALLPQSHMGAVKKEEVIETGLMTI